MNNPVFDHATKVRQEMDEAARAARAEVVQGAVTAPHDPIVALHRSSAWNALSATVRALHRVGQHELAVALMHEEKGRTSPPMTWTPEAR